MRSHHMNNLDNFIAGWYIDKNICDDIIDYFNNLETAKDENDDRHLKYDGVVGIDNNTIIDKSQKDSIDAVFPIPNKYEFAGKYIESLHNVLDQYMKKYHCSVDYVQGGISINEFPNIQYYPPAGGYKKWHCERTHSNLPVSARHLVFMTYLNDIEDEGGTEFYHQKVKLKPEKGLTVIWPADWTFTHRGIVSKTEEKYIVTGWFSFVNI